MVDIQKTTKYAVTLTYVPNQSKPHLIQNECGKYIEQLQTGSETGEGGKCQ